MKYKIRLTILLVLLGINFIFGQPSAQVEKTGLPEWIRPITKQPATINPNEISGGYYYELLEDQVHLGLQTVYHQEVRVILEDEGAQNAGRVEVNFDPTFQKLQIHRIQIERDGQFLDRLNLAKIKVIASETELSRFLYNGTYSAFMILEDVRKGDKIRFSYSLKGFNPVFEGKFSDYYSFGGYESVGLVHLAYIIPEGRKLNIKRFGSAAVEKKEQRNNLTYLYWEDPSTVTEVRSATVPLWFNSSPRVEVSEFSSWQQVANWAKHINPIPSLKSGTGLTDFINKLWVESNEDPEMFFEKSLDFVQNSVRYMGIEMGINSHQAHRPEQVFSQRFGDCKDKSLLLASMLKHKGISSSLVLVNSYRDKELDQSQPSPYAFNHMVLAVVIDGKMKAVDPTISNQGGRVMDRYFPYYGKVLFIENGESLNEVSKPSPTDYHVSIEDIIQLQDDGKAILNVKSIYRKNEADNMRTFLKESSKKNLQSDYENYYSEIYGGAKRLKDIQIEDNIKKNELVVHESYQLTSYLYKDGEDMLAPYNVKYLIDRLPQIKDNELNPVSLYYPTHVSYTVKFVNKDNITFGFVNDEKVIERESYWFSQKLYSKDDTLNINSVLTYHDTYIPMDQITAYKADYKEIVKLIDQGFYVYKDGVLRIGQPIDFDFNHYYFWFFVVLVVGSIITIQIYHKSTARNIINLDHTHAKKEVDGLTIFLGIFIVLMYATLLVNIFYGLSPIKTSFWLQINVSEGVNKVFLLLFSAIIAVLIPVLLVFSIYCLILFSQRRDIFPQTLFMVVIGFLVNTVLLESFYQVSELRAGFADLNISKILLSIVLGGSVLFYLLYSQNVKDTFNVSYKRKDD